RLGDSLSSFRRIVIPEPIDDFTTSRVLTMDYIPGKKITALSPLRLMEVDGAKLSEELFRAYLKQTLVDGFFHADPHPGNVFLTDDNRIALLDLGMVSNIGSTFQENYLRLLLAISNGRGDEAAEISIKMGEPKARFDDSDFRRRVADLVAEHADTALDRIDAIDERIVLDGLQKVANRITIGLVLAALIVGAALLMRIETSFRLFGYPGLPMIFFLLAAIGALILIFNILLYDKKPKKKEEGD